MSSLLFLIVGKNGSNMRHWSSDQFLEKEGTVWSVSFTTVWSVGLGGLEWEATDKYLFKEWIIWSVPFYHRVVRWGEQLPLLTPNNPIWRLSPSQLGRRPPNNGHHRHPGRQPRGGNLEFDNDFHQADFHHGNIENNKDFHRGRISAMKISLTYNQLCQMKQKPLKFCKPAFEIKQN